MVRLGQIALSLRRLTIVLADPKHSCGHNLVTQHIEFGGHQDSWTPLALEIARISKSNEAIAIDNRKFSSHAHREIGPFSRGSEKATVKRTVALPRLFQF